MRLLSLTAVAAALAAAALLLVIPFTGLAQSDTPDLQRLKPEKRAIVEREARDIAAAKAAPKPAKDQAKLARPQRQAPPLTNRTTGQPDSPVPHRAAGSGTIVDSGLAPFPASAFTFENRWFERTATGDLVVYAGAAHDDATQGLVVVRQVGAALGPATVYRTPARSGSVRIISADGRKLSLVSSGGARVVFDLTSRTFGP